MTPPASAGRCRSKLCISTKGARRLTARWRSQLSRVVVATVLFSKIEALLTRQPIAPSGAAAPRRPRRHLGGRRFIREIRHQRDRLAAGPHDLGGERLRILMRAVMVDC